MGLSDLPLLGPIPSGSVGAPADLAAAVREALETLGAAGDRLVVAVNDPQRHTDTRPVLEALAAHMSLRQVRILIGTGSHSYRAEDRRRFQERLLGGLQVAGVRWHDCRATDLVRIGGSGPHGWMGEPWLLDADGVLSMGSVEPHYFAGFTGAHKTATIGCAAHADIEHNHAAAMGPAPRPCRRQGNPVFEGIARYVGSLESVQRVAAVNLVQSNGRVIAAQGGGVMASLSAVAGVVMETFVRTIPAPADALIAEVGPPLDESFYQADKGIKNSEWALRDGGCLVLVAPCPKGIGQDDFLAVLREAATFEQAVECVRRRGYRLGDHKAVRLRHLTDPAYRGVRLVLVSEGITPEQAALLGATKATTAEEALSQAAVDPARQAVYRIADAGNTCVVVES